MKICIVGHGPSLKGRGLGQLIDSHEKVVRLKGSGNVIGKRDYGSKTDALCASTEIMGTFFKANAGEYWAYPKKGVYNLIGAGELIGRLEKPVMIPLTFCNHWNGRFRQMGACHHNVSTGMAAILISVHRWQPHEIVLAGFDTLLNPSVKFDRNPEIPRSGDGPYPNHDWQKENELLTVLRNVYKVDIHAIEERQVEESHQSEHPVRNAAR